MLQLKNMSYCCSVATMSSHIAVCVAAVIYSTSEACSSLYLAVAHAKHNLQFGAVVRLCINFAYMAAVLLMLSWTDSLLLAPL